MGGIFGGGGSYAGGGQEAYNQQQPSFPGYDYPNNVPMTGQDYGGGGDYGAYTSYGGGGGSPTDPGAGYYDTGGGGGAASGGGGILDWLGSEKGQRALQQLSGFSSGMLAGSAPSLQPRGFSTALAGGMQGFQQAGSQYYQDALHRAQSEKAIADAANLKQWTGNLQREAANATGLPPGYGGMPPVGQIPPAAPAAAGGGGAPTGPFAQYASLIQKYESAGKPYVGWGGTDLTNVPRDPETGFPQWGGKPGPAGNSTAAGLYQITKSTWDPIARELGIKDFTPESQHRVAEALYARRGLDPWLPYNKQLAAAVGRGEGGVPNPFAPAPAPAAVAGGPAVAPPPPPIRPPSPADAGTSVAAPPGLAARFPGVAGARPGLLPPAAPPPGAAVPPAQTAAPPTIAPAATTPPGTQAAAAPAAPGAPAGRDPPARVAPGKEGWLAVGDSIARGFVQRGGLPGKSSLDKNDLGADAAAGRDPQQVLDFIDTALQYDPNYFRGKNVLLSTGVSNDPSMIDRVPAQLAKLKDAGANVTVVGVGNKAGKEAGQDFDLRPFNQTLQQYAAGAKAGFAGALPAVVHPERGYYAKAAAKLAGAPGTAGGGRRADAGGETQVAAAPAGPITVEPLSGEAVPAGSVPPPRQPGPMSLPGGVPVGAAPAVLARPISMPGGVPYGAEPPAPAIATGPAAPPSPPPAPGAAVAPPVPAGPSPAAATGPGAMPAPPPVERAQTLPVPNLGQIQPPGMGGIPLYNVEAARRAQILSIAGAATGRQVPSFLSEQANLPNKALEQQWAQQKELYGQQLQGARDQWKAMNDAQQTEVAARNGLTKAQFESELRIREENLKQGRMYNPQTGRFEAIPGAQEITAEQAGATTGAQQAAQQPYELQRITAQQEAQRQRELDTPKEYTVTDPQTNTPRTIIATPRQMQAGTNQPGMPPGYQSGANPTVTARIDLHKTAATEARQVAATGQRLAPIFDEVLRIGDKAGPIGAYLAGKLSAAGFPVSEHMANSEVLRSLSQQLIPTVRQPGAQSNAEMAVYSLAVPGLQQSAVGRAQIAHLNRAMVDRANEIANLREDNIGAADLSEKLTALHNKPLFTDGQRAVMNAATGRPIDKATYDLLPPGMDYTDPKGVKRTKPAAQ